MKLQISSVGICGSDIQRLDMGEPLAELGHEIIGRHQDRYYAINPIAPCGECEDCKKQMTRFCQHATLIGKNGAGGFSGKDITVPSKNAIPLKDDTPAYILADPVACVIHGMSLITKPFSTKTLVVGDGVMAILFVELFQEKGVPVSQAVKNTARHKRAHPKSAVANFYEIKDRYDTIILCVGGTSAEIINRCIGLLNNRGNLLIAGAYHYIDRELDIKSLLKKEIVLQGTFSYEPEDFKAAVDIIQKNTGFFNGLIRDTFSSPQLERAVQHHRTNNTRLKVVVKYD